ncbi:hypothetical protein PYW08_002183 [Mythimna loreyi]|uniref:Uncharacterized protein n=1 Tax=Mythimna loreyi TaxID=667449 RepID=A0ACC2R110_9NEOP|nr:hypothetical protein PYW08_002183 [Mythimna loreyi]
MMDKLKNLQCFLIVVFIKLLGAQEVPNTSSNQGSSPSSLQPRFSDLGAMGFPNFGSGRVGNPTSNYPTNSFFPFGNQNNFLQRPQQGSGMGYPNQGNLLNRPQDYPQQQGYPNQQGYPYQGDSMNPNPNYQQPQYPNQNIQNRPVQGGYPNLNAYPYQGDSNTRYPNYQRPYLNRPDDGSIMYPDNINGPYQNGVMPPNQGGPGQSFQFPQDNQYPQGNYQGNPNISPNGVNPNFRPDDLGNLPNTNLHFPDGPYQYQPNQYYPQTNSPNQNIRPVQGQPGSYPNYLSNNNNPNNNIQFPMNSPGGVNPSAIQYPNQAIPSPVGSGIDFSGPSANPGNFNNVHQNQPPLPNNQGNNPSDNDTTAILGKPVIVPPTNTPPGQAGLDNSATDAATQKKCVQDCPSTSEYAPVCGTDNVTYVNPGKFDCAQKCGVAVHLQKVGRCPEDIVSNTLQQS